MHTFSDNHSDLLNIQGDLCINETLSDESNEFEENFSTSDNTGKISTEIIKIDQSNRNQFYEYLQDLALIKSGDYIIETNDILNEINSLEIKANSEENKDSSYKIKLCFYPTCYHVYVK